MVGALALVACGGSVEPFMSTVEAGSDAAQDAGPSTWCVPDAAPDKCGNIQRFRADGTVEDGCCVGATPYCAAGACVQFQP